MAQLAIKGHATRGKEVIEILEMLGGINTDKINYTDKNLLYCLREGDNVVIATYPNSFITNVFTLERFIEKFPYKIGDRVRVADYESEVRIDSMLWDGREIQYQVFTDETEWYSAEELNKYNEINKEEAMEKGIIYDEIDFNRCPCADKVQLILGDNYEIQVEDGKTFVVRKKPQYPKTFIECAKILNCFSSSHIDGYKNELLEKLQELIIYRDAYWKLSGDWEPVHQSGKDTTFYAIHRFNNEIIKGQTSHRHSLLEFPNEEMRDAFYENFKELIESCKEFL